MPIYRSGTIGKAKEDLEKTTAALSATLHERIGGAAYVSVNKALVTQASAAIPVVPLYISAALQGDEGGGHARGDGRADRAAVSRPPRPRAHAARPTPAGRIRIDDLEMDPAVQARVSELWKTGDHART